MSVEKIATADKADAAKLLERQVVTVKALVVKTYRLADSTQRLADINIALIDFSIYIATSLEGLYNRYKIVVSSLKRMFNLWLICRSIAIC